MRMSLSGHRLFVAALTVAVGFLVAQPVTSTSAQLSSAVAYDSVVVLPTKGGLDERPFFSTRRHPAIEYDGATEDVVGELARKVADGTVKLRYEERSGYLRSVLEALHIPTESQAVVFSKTSLQSHYISPANPRAIFFSDDVTLGFIPGAPLMEISALDPRQGVVFYAIEQRPSDRPLIERGDSCLSCHESRNTLDVPGMLARSMAVGTGGQTMPEFGNFISDHRSPFEERWGGWFITGDTGMARHMGNTTLEPNGSAVRASGTRTLASLDGKFNLEGYPSHYSDVAAVMVLDHQVRMTNLLTRVGWETRVALDQQTRNPQDKEVADRLIEADARELVDYMLFVDEAPLPGKFKSTSGFSMKFAESGPRDRAGRSLKELDLTKRLFRYPCSYMIYSRAFDQLPAAAKDAVYTRLWSILSEKEKSPKYAKLSRADRVAVAGILLETKTDLPSYFRPLEK
jgi:hypothetical protein